MPTRILRDGIITSQRVNRLSERSELFFRRLMSVVDDYGRFYAHQAILRAHCYPLRLDKVSEADAAEMLKECVEVGLIRKYDKGTYLEIDKFKQRTRSKSKFPDPPWAKGLSNCQQPASGLPSNWSALPRGLPAN